MPRRALDEPPKDRLECQQDLDDALAALIASDPRLVAILAAAGATTLRRYLPGFAGLAKIIVGQQLSTASAAAIWTRLSRHFGSLSAADLLRADTAGLGRLGLSQAKIRSLQAIAAAISEGRLDLDGLAMLDADSAHAVLTRLPGIGPWTADVYMLFCLGKADAWPAGDLAVQEAMRIGLGLASRPGPKDMAALAECWRPYRGAVAHLWWAYYHAIRRQGRSVA